MNKAAKKQWIAALRSGEYKQGFGAMHRDDGTFCPLGVLCDIEIDGDWEEVDRPTIYSLPFGNRRVIKETTWWEIEGERLYPPRNLLKRLGLSSQDTRRITWLSDAERRPFDLIAAVIELQL